MSREKNIYPEELKQEIVALYKSGLRVTDIVLKTGVRDKPVYKILKDSNLIKPKQSREKIRLNPTLSTLENVAHNAFGQAKG